MHGRQWHARRRLHTSRSAAAACLSRRCRSVRPPAAAVDRAVRQASSSLHDTHVSTLERIDADEFRTVLASSTHCQPSEWVNLDVDILARLYDTKVTAILDEIIPSRTVRCRSHASDPWFNQKGQTSRPGARATEAVAAATDL